MHRLLLRRPTIGVLTKLFIMPHGQRIPVNVVDQPDLCQLYRSSIVDRSPVMIAVGTSGASPVALGCSKPGSETLIPTAYGRLCHRARFSQPGRQSSVYGRCAAQLLGGSISRKSC